MRILRWTLLPLAALGAFVLTAALFLYIHSSVIDRCARYYYLDVPICPAAWAPVVLSLITCIGSFVAAGSAIAAAYAVAPARRHAVALLTAVAVAMPGVWLFILHLWWQFLFTALAGVGALLFVRRRDTAPAPNT